MIPHTFVPLKAFPLTPNGKVDRKALPKPTPIAPKDRYIISPRNAVEVQLRQIWEDLFGISPIGVQDNFLDIGGDSLLAIRLIAKVEQAFETRIAINTLFQNGTIEHLAALLRGDLQPPTWSPLVCLQAQGSKTPIFFIHASGGSAFNYLELATLMGTERPFYALNPRGTEPSDPFHDTIEAMAADYVAAISRVQAEGPLPFGWLVIWRYSWL